WKRSPSRERLFSGGKAARTVVGGEERQAPGTPVERVNVPVRVVSPLELDRHVRMGQRARAFASRGIQLRRPAEAARQSSMEIPPQRRRKAAGELAESIELDRRLVLAGMGGIHLRDASAGF